MRNAQAGSSMLKPAASIPTPLGHAIEVLLDALVDFQRQGRDAVGKNSPRLIVWEDEDYQYVESVVDNKEITLCDLNILAGKIYIRIAKEQDAENEESSEFRPLLRATFPIDTSINE